MERNKRPGLVLCLGVLAALLSADVPQTVEEKRAFLLANHIALWDVIASCWPCAWARRG